MNMRLSLSILTALALTACGADQRPAHARSDEAEATAPALTRLAASCDAGTYAYGTLLATRSGAVFAQRQSADTVRIQRLRGAGCDLVPVGAPLVARQLLDVDELGNLYVFPAAAPDDGSAVGTVPASESEFLSGVVARVDETDVATTVIPANRGVWSFGVSPTGDAMWVTACGPNGIYAIDAFAPDAAGAGHAPKPLLAAPETLWGQLPSVLTDAGTFWSVGTSACASDAPLSDACGLALVRATPSDVMDVGATVADFGGGFERATLRRCGAHVCAAYPSAVVVHDAEGAARAVLSFDGAEWGEYIGAVSGTDAGIYVQFYGPRGGRRLLYAPLE